MVMKLLAPEALIAGVLMALLSSELSFTVCVCRAVVFLPAAVWLDALWYLV